MIHSKCMPFLQYAETVRREIEDALDRHTRFDDACPPILKEAIRHSLLGGGKRLRPLLVLMATEACGGPRPPAMPAACAVEMVHTYSLIHDDLPAMDDDDVRRGRPSCHAQFGEAIAILAGDALLARAFDVLAAEIRPAETAARCCLELGQSAGASALVGGQVDDLLADPSAGSVDQLVRIHRRKTGRMFTVSARLGGLIAGADQQVVAALDGFGKKLGLAFQIIDDLLDRSGDQAAPGKGVDKGDPQGKMTFPALVGEAESRRRAERLIGEAQEILRPLAPEDTHLRSLAQFVLERIR